MLKRIISLILVALMLLTSLVACGTDDVADADDGSGAVSTVGGEGDKYSIGDAVGIRDYGGKVVTIGHCAHDGYDGEISVGALTGDLVDDAIYTRNVTVSERLNIKLEDNKISGGKYSVTDKVRADFQGGTKSFDIAYSALYILCNLNKEGLYYDLNDCVDIDFEKPYWGGYASEALEIGGIQYNATGALCLNFYKYVHATVVNNRILDEKEGETPDLFKVVEDGEWTLEYQRKLANDYYQDLGDPGKDEISDVIGFYGYAGGISCDSYLSACKVSIISKDNMGYLTVGIDTDRMSRAADEVIALHSAEGAVMQTASKNQSDLAVGFTKGNVLMTTLNFGHISDTLNTMEDKYLILPMPKLDTKQDQYYSFLHDGATAVSIPVTVAQEDVQMIGAVMECLASEGYRLMAPAYYETVLKGRAVSNPENWKVIDNIFASVLMDPMTPYAASLKVNGDGPISHWRSVIKSSVNDGANVFGSTFNAEYMVQLSTVINGENGLNAFYRAQNAGN